MGAGVAPPHHPHLGGLHLVALGIKKENHQAMGEGKFISYRGLQQAAFAFLRWGREKGWVN